MTPNPPVVDAHVHLHPGRLGEKVREFFAPMAESLQYPLDHGLVRAQLAAEGFTEIWALPYAHKPGVADGLNESTRHIAEAPGPLSVVAGCTAHPGDPDPAATVRRAVEDLGARVLKLHCSVGDYAADDERLSPMWDYAQQVALPVVVHVGHDTNGQTSDHELGPIQVVAERHPDAVIVIAHCALPAVTDALDLIEGHRHVYGDVTPVMWEPPAIPPDRWRAVGGKLLFGSDAPNSTINAAAHLAAVREQCDTDDHRTSISGGLARRLVGAVRG